MRATVSHYEIPASDPEWAARFYRQVFGWRVEPLAVASGGPSPGEISGLSTFPCSMRSTL